MKGERVDHITLSSQSQVSGYIRKENFPQFFFSTFDVDKLGKIRRYHWKKSLKISEIAKFESDLLKTNDEIAPQKREILNTFFMVMVEVVVPPTIQTSVNVRNFQELYFRSLKTYHFQIWQFY